MSPGTADKRAHRALLCGDPRQGRSTSTAEVRLLCFPHAGGGASLYAPWRDALGSKVEVVAVQLPGREGRLREPPFDRLDEIVSDVCEQLAEQAPRPFALFGHSMGAVLAFEVARAMRREGRKADALFVSAARAPHLGREGPPRHTLPDAAFRAMLDGMGGTPPAVAGDPDLMALFMPGLRADFAVYDTYSYRPEPALDCPISVFRGMADQEVGASDLEAWSAHTSQKVRMRTLPGGHFFLRTAARQVTLAILADLEAARAADRPSEGVADPCFPQLPHAAAWPTGRRSPGA